MSVQGYELLDCGAGRKLERFGEILLDRPAAGAIWSRQHLNLWKKSHAKFERRDEKSGTWHSKGHLPKKWRLSQVGLSFELVPNAFGHIGIFPEQSEQWQWLQEKVKPDADPVLNLFAYSGGSTLACAKAGAKVVHLDASRPMVQMARRNAELNGLGEAPISWLTEDVLSFLRRELRRKKKYQGIILDPPSFGRGPKNQLFKFERDLPELIAACRDLLADKDAFILLSCHTPGFTPISLENTLRHTITDRGQVVSGEMLLSGENEMSLPSGVFARWEG